MGERKEKEGGEEAGKGRKDEIKERRKKFSAVHKLGEGG